MKRTLLLLIWVGLMSTIVHAQKNELPVRIQEMVESANKLFRSEQFKEAADVYENAAKEYKSQIGEDEQYAFLLKCSANCYSRNEDFQNAINVNKIALSVLQEKVGEASNLYAVTLSNQAYYYHSIGDIENAFSHIDKAIACYQKVENVDKQEFLLTLNDAMEYLYSSEYINYDLAIKYGELIVKNYSPTEIVENANQVYKRLAQAYSAIGNYEKGIEYEKAFISQKKDIEERAEILLVEDNLYLSYYYLSNSNIEEGMKLFKESMELFREAEYSVISFDFFEDRVWNDLALYIMCDDIIDKHGLQKEMQFAIDKAEINYRLAALCYQLEDNENTELFIDKSYTLFKSLVEEKTASNRTDLLTRLINVAYNAMSIKMDIGNRDSAIKIIEETLYPYYKDKQEYSKDEAEKRLDVIKNYALFLSEKGFRQKAIELSNDNAIFAKKTFGGESQHYAATLRRLATAKADIYDKDEAYNLCKTAVQIYERIDSCEDMYYSCLRDLAVYANEKGNVDEGVMLLEKVYNYFSEKEPNSTFYHYLLSDMAMMYREQKNYDKALSFFEEARSRAETTNDVIAQSYILREIARIYLEEGEKEKSYDMSLKALNLLKQHKYDYNDISLFALGDCAIRAFACSRYLESASFQEEYITMIKGILSREFAFMSQQERTKYWSRLNIMLLENFPSIAVEAQSTKTIENAYNALLLGKGMLLSVDNQVTDIVGSSNNGEVKQLYNDISRAIQLLESGNISAEIDCDNLIELIESKQRELSKLLNLHSSFEKEFAITWNDVKDALSDDEVSIEFYEDSYLNEIYAFVITKSMEAPQIVNLGRQTKGTDIWRHFEKYLKGKKTIYFSPMGILHTLPIENYIDDGRKYIRVSSTREVVTNKQQKQSADKPMKLYGGLKYDMTIDALTGANKEYKLEESEQQDLYAYAKRSSRDAITQVVFDELKGTLKEVQAIEGIAKSNKRKCEVLTGEQGTEESLRAINGKRYGILHFSTHGFYWTEEEAENRALDNRLSFLRMGDDQPRRYEEDKSMTRSGLIFSGANLAMEGAELPEGMEDGIATAQEISHLDLRGCDLVVLSACQTGLGEVSGEGVFGLQRGFKKAGVNSILMSLWEVDDRATQMLMVEFYKHYLAGDSKLESLRKAQNYVKSQPGFESPEYWAAFILLDGIN